MSTVKGKQIIREWIRRGRVWPAVLEEIEVAVLGLLPRRFCMQRASQQIASGVYGCAESDVFLYKSGRAALRGLMEALRTASPDRRTVCIPDYVCNVVGEACRAAGFETVEYPTDERCLPRWKELEERVRRDAAPVVVLCSLFGSVPLLAPEVAALETANPRLFIVADECQNLVPDSPVKPRKNRAVVFSFNDKTTPGLMGGGVVCLQASGVKPRFVLAPLGRRMLCAIALGYRWLMGMLRNAGHVIRLLVGKSSSHGLPKDLEYSTCLRPQYDVLHESIYRLSAARACVSLRFLDTYRRLRMENAAALQAICAVDSAAVRAAPPFLPLAPGDQHAVPPFPAPVKAPYGRSASEVAAPNHGVSLKINNPLVGYETRACTVAQLTSRHAITDNRILHGMARTSEKAGYPSVVMGPAAEDGEYGKIRLQACPVMRDGRRPSAIGLWWALLHGALRSRYPIFHIHDPDLLPVGLLLKLFGRCVIYDVHDDYPASFKDRLRRRPWVRKWFPSVWWGFEKTAARLLDGVVVADRHLARKFASCHPVVMGNYPRLDFTPPATAEGEETFNLIYVGGVTRERGLEMALLALEKIDMPGLRLHVIGTSRETDLLERLRANPRVVLHGRVPWTELHRHYTRAHAGLALYQPLESFLYYPGENAVKVVEYMAAGIPVLCSNFPGLKAFVEDSGCGKTVPPDDPDAIAGQIRHLIEHPEQRREWGAAGRRLFEGEYNWEKQEPRLVELYQRMEKR